MVNLRHIHSIPLAELQQLANNYNIARNLKDAFPHPYTKQDAAEFMKLAEQNRLGHVFGIFYDDTFTGVGSIVPKEDIYRISGEIGYWIGEPFWGKGIASAAVKLLTTFAFRELGLTRLYAGVFQHNTASMKVLEKSGYTLEAIIKSSIIKNDTIMDEYLYSILAKS
jgi:RimJ/RimL family protein N-acetyltransferase